MGSLAIHFMQITKRQNAIIIGTLLGDGCLERNGKYCRLRLEHSNNQKLYLLWKYKNLKNISGKVMPLHYYHKVHKKFYDNTRVYTFSDKIFDFYWNIFYRTGKKTIPSNMASFLIDPLSLAVWLMDDGYKRNDCNAFRLSTDSYTKNEQCTLQSVLKNNFGIDSTLHKKGKYWNVYIPERESKKFVSLVKKYIIPSLSYKIALTP